MSKHTPGPWRIGSLESYDGYTGQPYRNVWAGQDEAATVVARAIRSDGAMTNDVDADARLIASAPDLLAICKELAESAAYWSEYDVPLGIVERLTEAITKAEAA